jgi:indoleamine 2,3-dioxygenase
MQLSDYGMSRARGYLSAFEIDEIALPGPLDPIVEVAEHLSGLITSGQVRHWLDRLPDPQIENWAASAPVSWSRPMSGARPKRPPRCPLTSPAR